MAAFASCSAPSSRERRARPPLAPRNDWNCSLCSRNGDASSCAFTYARNSGLPSALASWRASFSGFSRVASLAVSTASPAGFRGVRSLQAVRTTTAASAAMVRMRCNMGLLLQKWRPILRPEPSVGGLLSLRAGSERREIPGPYASSPVAARRRRHQRLLAAAGRLPDHGIARRAVGSTELAGTYQLREPLTRRAARLLRAPVPERGSPRPPLVSGGLVGGA